jgi:hypothetical protein
LLQAINFELKFGATSQIRGAIAFDLDEHFSVRVNDREDLCDLSLKRSERRACHRRGSGDGASPSGLSCH